MFKKIIKIIGIISIFLFVAVAGYIIGNMTKYNLDVKKVDKAVNRFQGSLEEPYKKDIYGGKTPEETWGMYIDALKKGNIDLASRYYRVGDQGKRKNFLLGAKNRDNLKLYLEQLSAPLLKDTSLPDFILADKTRAHYFYSMKSPENGEILNHSIEFYLNPYTEIWKILD